MAINASKEEPHGALLYNNGQLINWLVFFLGEDPIALAGRSTAVDHGTGLNNEHG